MTGQVCETIRRWLGWCPNALTMRNERGVSTSLPSTLLPAQSGGSAGGSPGRIDRGIHLAAGSILILVRNRWLFWFSLLTGLSMIFSMAASLYLLYISGTNPLPGTGLFPETPTILIGKGSVLWTVLTFITMLVSTALAYSLLAGLIACVSVLLTGSTTSIGEGLSRARDHMRTLVGWAGIGAVAGTMVSFLSNGYTADYPSAFLSMIPFMVFFILTLFVIPAIVLDNAGLIPAIKQSLSLFRNVWAEIIVCFMVFLLIIFLISISSLIPLIMIGFSSGSSAMAGAVVVIYMLILFGIIIIGSTVLGIATYSLYSFAKNGTVPPLFNEKQGANIPI